MFRLHLISVHCSLRFVLSLQSTAASEVAMANWVGRARRALAATGNQWLRGNRPAHASAAPTVDRRDPSRYDARDHRRWQFRISKSRYRGRLRSVASSARRIEWKRWPRLRCSCFRKGGFAFVQSVNGLIVFLVFGLRPNSPAVRLCFPIVTQIAVRRCMFRHFQQRTGCC